MVSEIEATVEGVTPMNRGYNVLLSSIEVLDYDSRVEKAYVSFSKRYLSADETINKDLIGSRVRCKAMLDKIQQEFLPNHHRFFVLWYFNDIGATGYGMSNMQVLYQTRTSYLYRLLHKIRAFIHARFDEVLGPAHGGFTAAITLGNLKCIKKQDLESIRIAGISHVLCVSGLHISLVIGICAKSIRFILNLFGVTESRIDARLISYSLATIGGYFYLKLSGTNIAATRAFLMGALMVVGLVKDRGVFYLRHLGVAAFVMLCFRPEYILSPSFQLSFISVASLIAGFQFFPVNVSGNIAKSFWNKILSNLYSSFLASIVVAPIAIFNFCTFSTYSIPANLIVVPIIAIFFMPLLVLCLILMPFGFDYYPLKGLDFFIKIILNTCRYIQNLPYSILYTGFWCNESVCLFCFGFAVFVIIQAKLRFVGVVMMLISAVYGLCTQTPDLIVSVHAGHVGFKQDDGFKIYSNSLSKFYAQYWSNWMGQKEIYRFKKHNSFILSNGSTLRINSTSADCSEADIQINKNNAICNKGRQIIDIGQISDAHTILLFCQGDVCNIEPVGITNLDRVLSRGY
ncbi:ComEC/Rec2 family competence protein [Candidatus Sarmatiella mevalonica]|uniref:ComEC/Rec2 family competence protein n=1 Tax=Candidatus Sarmatiella mevalonica TaxID=2770581 RepID=UPI001923B9F4|nr:ComEC/Rec2 family competence protein [Candidatus Sarmatiella mevalonica]